MMSSDDQVRRASKAAECRLQSYTTLTVCNLEILKSQNVDDEVPPEVELLPWSDRIFNGYLSSDTEGGRLIEWIYSIVAEVGKTTFASHLMAIMGALVIAPDSVRDVKHMLLETVKRVLANEELRGTPEFDEKLGLFYENPIVILDLSRTESRMINQMALYTTMENISGNFHSTKYQGGQVIWWRLPKILVLANGRPNVAMLSPDRFNVSIIGHDSLDLIKDTPVDVQLAEYAEELKAAQAEREREIAECNDGLRERDPVEDAEEMIEIFMSVYKVVPGAKAIRSQDMYFWIKRAGYSGTQADMNKWIEEFFADEIAAEAAVAGSGVKKTKPGNKHCWKGFVRSVPMMRN